MEYVAKQDATFAMTTKRLVIGFFIVIFGMLWLLNKQGKSLRLHSSSESNGFDSTNQSIQRSLPLRREDASNSVLVQEPTVRPSQRGEEDTSERVRAVIDARNVPIEFWGKVIDQADSPLAEVSIEAQVRHWDYSLQLGTSEQTLTRKLLTKADGLFHVGGETGDDLVLNEIQKDGYELEPNAKTGFGFSSAEQFTSRPESPVVFKMWRKEIRGSLITREQSFKIEPDGRPYMIDLMQGSIANTGGGDLRIWIRRPPVVGSGQRFDWSAGVEVIKGGLSQELDPGSSMFMAPEAGYTNSLQWQHKAAEDGWSDSTGEQRIFVTLRNGAVFGRLSIEEFAFYNNEVPSRVVVKYALNPSGSRVLR